MATYSESDFQKLVEKIKGNKGADLSMAEDLSLAVMNLISLEEHFFFTGVKTGKDEYFDTVSEIRQVRKGAMESLVDKHEGETWCATKHLLATTMRLIEVANRLQTEGKKPEAKEMYSRAYKIYSIFWALRLKLITVKEVVNDAGKDLKKNDGQWTLEDITNKLADCCSE